MESQAIFQAETQAKLFSIELGPRGAFVFKMLGIPMSLAPPVVGSAGNHFGEVSGAPGHGLPSALDGATISAVLSDQSASLFGSGCLGRGDAKITLGTGSFLTINTGDTAHASLGGLVPFVRGSIQ